MGKGIAVAYASAGGIILYSGIKGATIADTLKAVLSGNLKVTPTEPIGSASPAASSGGTAPSGKATGSAAQAASDALRYEGSGYVWGGAPGLGPGNWDCSSFANWVYGHDLGLAIPGYSAGSYTGTVHGPATGDWILWGGLTTIGHDGSVAQAGDVCVWQTHMGIATGSNQMISAQDPQNGTQVSGIDGFIPGEELFVRRYG